MIFIFHRSTLPLIIFCWCLINPFTKASGTNSDIHWIDGRNLTVRGRAFNDTKSFWNRLPAAAEGTVRSSIWSLSEQTAGMYVLFESDSPVIHLNYTLTRKGLSMWHFPSTGVSGADLYMYEDGNNTWRWVATTRNIAFPVSSNTFSVRDNNSSTKTLQKFKLHTPTYNGLSQLLIGVEKGYSLQPGRVLPPGPKPPVVWYGSSICQGGVASRPGQAYTNILSRSIELDGHDVLNFGFSGNCLMELDVAKFLTMIPAAMFIIDCLPNMNAAQVTERTIPLINFIRSSSGHSETPIIVAEGTNYGTHWFAPQSNDDKRKALRAEFDKLISSGIKNLHYVNGSQLFFNAETKKDDHVDPTVGGTHPTDLGMVRMATFYKKILPNLLPKKQSNKLGNIFKNNQQFVVNYSATSNFFKLDKITMEINPNPNATVPLTIKSPVNFEEQIMVEDNILLELNNKTWYTSEDFLDMVDLGVQGRGFPINTTDTAYQRLPSIAKKKVREQVWELSTYSTGLYVRFTTDAPQIAVNYSLINVGKGLWHMPPTGTSGLDLYAYDIINPAWRHVGVSRSFSKGNNTWHVNLPGREKQYAGTNITYILYLPIRNSLSTGAIGVPDSHYYLAGFNSPADIAPVLKQPSILWYGTSIQQGGVASRAGNEYDAIISRRLGRNILNFGFAGNGKMELNVAAFLTEVNPVAVIIIDCLPNMNAASVANNTAPLVHFFRKLHSTTPIVLVEGSNQAEYHHWSRPSVRHIDAMKNEALHTAYMGLLSEGVKDIYYVTSNQLLPNSFINPTVGGTHPSDLGQYKIADFWIKFLPKIL